MRFLQNLVIKAIEQNDIIDRNKHIISFASRSLGYKA